MFQWSFILSFCSCMDLSAAILLFNFIFFFVSLYWNNCFVDLSIDLLIDPAGLNNVLFIVWYNFWYFDLTFILLIQFLFIHFDLLLQLLICWSNSGSCDLTFYLSVWILIYEQAGLRWCQTPCLVGIS